MKREAAQKLLEISRDSYNKMAKEFSRTRAKFWDELAFLSEHATPGMRVLDIGCGNGRLYPILKKRQVEYTGVDNSEGLLDEARQLHPEANFVLGDATALPFPDNSFDIAYSFAAIHHIPSRALRHKFIAEVSRILHPGNTFVITTWYLWSPDRMGKFLLGGLKSLLLLSPLDLGDIMLTFGKDRHERYLHAFTERELKQLLTKNGFEIIGSEILERQSSSGQKNILVVARKTARS